MRTYLYISITFLSKRFKYVPIEIINKKMLISFLNNVDIQLILEFKNSFGKFGQNFPKIP